MKTKMRRIAAFVFALLMVLPLFCLSTPADAGRLSIYRNHESDGLPFEVLNMLPGDVETKDYLVNVSYRGSVELFFQATVRKDTDADGNLVDPKLQRYSSARSRYREKTESSTTVL